MDEVSQSTIMVGVLIAGFIMYLAAKQRLAVYWSLLTGGGGSTGSGGIGSDAVAAPNAPAPTVTQPGFVPSVPGTTPNTPGTSSPPIGSIDWPNVAPDTPVTGGTG